MKTKIFICHRSDEKNIADVVSKHFQDWGIPKTDIFQASDSKAGTRIGGKLEAELKTALAEANLLVFVYTHRMYDWSYCTWECGVSLNPHDEEEDTNIVVFECAGDSPVIFEPNVRVQVTSEGIRQFTYQFHRDKNFFPNQPPFNECFGDDILTAKAERFYEDLLEVIPREKYKESPRLHLIKLSLEAKYATKVKKARTPKAVHDYIQDHLRVVEASSYCPQHFGFESFDEKMQWSLVVERWKDNTETQTSDLWIKDLYDEIWRAIRKELAKPAENILTSVAQPERQYIPLTCLMCEYPDGKIEFSVYLYLKK